MDQEEFITIKEFAQRAGVSHQAIYDRLRKENDELRKYTKVHNKIKLINIKALALFDSSKLAQVAQPMQASMQATAQALAGQKDDIISLLKEQVAVKDKQIEQRDNQIEQLQQDLSASREDLARLATELAKIADQGQHLQMKMMLPDGQQTTQQPEEPDATAAPIQDAEVIHESTREEQHPIDGKKDDDDIVMGGRLDGMPDIPSSINWWMVVAIVAIIALIAGVLYYLWGIGYI